jgi:hypothetical protein
MDAERREPDCASCRQLRHEVQILRQQVAQLAAALEQEQRRGKRPAAPFSKGPPAAVPKKPGRKQAGGMVPTPIAASPTDR